MSNGWDSKIQNINHLGFKKELRLFEYVTLFDKIEVICILNNYNIIIMLKILITTIPFADKNNLPLELLKSVGAEVTINPIGRKLKEEELMELVGDYDILIAGTEPITSKVLHKAKKLKLISRVGIGLDSVDLSEAKKRGIMVSYTPDAPAPAVAELTMGLMLSLLRNIHLSNIEMHRGQWYRYFGRR